MHVTLDCCQSKRSAWSATNVLCMH